MRVVSVNLNQRLGKNSSRGLLEGWLGAVRPDLLLTQEPWRPESDFRGSIKGFNILHSTSHLAAWTAIGTSGPDVSSPDSRWQMLRFPSLTIHHLYLSPYSARSRREMLDQVSKCASDREPTILVGDFNLAPRLEDGLFGEAASTFTKKPERDSFEQLLQSGALRDATATKVPEFSFVRVQNGKLIRFRCDLALISTSLATEATVIYDHSVRAKTGFTDHSAVIVDLPQIQLAGLPSDADSSVPTLGANETGLGDDQFIAASHKTAIKRSEPSQVARVLAESRVLPDLNVESILDFGCGYGTDVSHYRHCGFFAEGYDRDTKFGSCSVSRKRYDLVTLVYVVNVLPSKTARLDVVRAAAEYVRPGGFLLIAARSQSAVNAEAGKGSWRRHNDGWISSSSKGTFQRGIPPEEIGWLAGAAGLEYFEIPLQLSRDTSWIFAHKPVAKSGGVKGRR